jgi:hypothetical protein
MKRSGRKSTVALAGLLCTFGLGTAAASAQAYSWSIDVTGPPTGRVGDPLALKVSGKNPPPGEYWFNSYFSVDALPASAVSACPAGHAESSQMAVQTSAAGGTHVTPVWVRENPNGIGDWSASVAYTPKAAGRMLICAYTNDGFSNTEARAHTAISVRQAGAMRKRCKKAKRASAAKKCRKRR